MYGNRRLGSLLCPDGMRKHFGQFVGIGFGIGVGIGIGIVQFGRLSIC